MALRRTSSVFATLALFACDDAATLRWAPPPPISADTHAVLVAVEHTAGVRLYAFDAEHGVDLALELSAVEASDATRVVAYRYPDDLDALDLAEGPVAAPGARSCRLETPTDALQVELPLDTSWRPAPAELPATVRDALFGSSACEAPDLCLEFTAERVAVDGADQWRAMLALDDRLLLVDGAGRYYTIDREARVTRREDLDPRFHKALARTWDGELWFGGAGGRLARGPLDGPVERLDVQTSTSAEIVAIADSPSGDTLVLSIDEGEVVDRVQVFWRNDGAWQTVYDHDAYTSSWWESDVAWADDDRAVIVYGGLDVLTFERGEVDVFDLRGLDVFEHVTGAAVIGADGNAYIGSRFGTVLQSAPPFEDWRPIGHNPVPNAIQALTRFGASILVGATRGFVGQYQPGGRSCDGRTYHGANSHLLQALDGRIFTAGGGGDATDVGYVVRLTPL